MHTEFAQSSLSAGPAPESSAGLCPCSCLQSDSISAMDAVVEFVFLQMLLGCWNRNPGQPECCHGSACLICQPIPDFMVLSNCRVQLVLTAATGLTTEYTRVDLKLTAWA